MVFTFFIPLFFIQSHILRQQMGSTIFKAHMAPNINFKIAAKMAAMYLIT